MKQKYQNKYQPKKEKQQNKPAVNSEVGREVSNSKSKKKAIENNFSLQAIILFIFAFLLYSNTLTHKYTLDDMLAITSNKYTKQGVNGIKNILTHDAFDGFFGEKKNLLTGGRYRPLAQITFAIETELCCKKTINTKGEMEFKIDKDSILPTIQHFINVLLYALMSVVLFFTLRKLFKTYSSTDWYLSMPFLITCLFIAHPLHTEAVANIKGRDEIMSMFGSLAALWFAIKYVETKNIIHLILTPVFFIIGVLSKENAITFFAVIPLTIFVFTNSRFKDFVLIMFPLFIGLIIYFIIRKAALGFMFSNNVVEKELLNNPFVDASANEKYATIFYTWLIYLKLLFFPHPLTHDYYPKQIELITWTSIKAIGSFLIFTGLTVFSVKTIFKKNLIAYSILFFLITFSIQSNLIFNIGAFMNERFMFAPLLGFCIIMAFFVNTYLPMIIKEKEIYRQIVIIFILFLLTGYSIKTVTRNFTWKDDFTLFTTDVHTSSNSAKCNVSAGGMWIEEANRQKDSTLKTEYLHKAIEYLNKGVSIHYKHVAGWILLGNAYMNLKDYASSLYNYECCLKVTPGHPDAMTNLKALGQNCVTTKKYDLAVRTYKTYLTYRPDDTDIQILLAEQYPYINKADSGIIILNQVIAKKPNEYRAYNKLGQIYGQYYKDISKAILLLDKAIEIKPDDPSTLENLGVACGISGQFDKSIFYLEKAIKENPNNSQLYVNLGQSYLQKKNTEKANECFMKAQEIKAKQKPIKN